MSLCRSCYHLLASLRLNVFQKNLADGSPRVAYYAECPLYTLNRLIAGRAQHKYQLDPLVSLCKFTKRRALGGNLSRCLHRSNLQLHPLLTTVDCVLANHQRQTKSFGRTERMKFYLRWSSDILMSTSTSPAISNSTQKARTAKPAFTHFCPSSEY